MNDIMTPEQIDHMVRVQTIKSYINRLNQMIEAERDYMGKVLSLFIENVDLFDDLAERTRISRGLSLSTQEIFEHLTTLLHYADQPDQTVVIPADSMFVDQRIKIDYVICTPDDPAPVDGDERINTIDHTVFNGYYDPELVAVELGERADGHRDFDLAFGYAVVYVRKAGQPSFDRFVITAETALTYFATDALDGEIV